MIIIRDDHLSDAKDLIYHYLRDADLKEFGDHN